MEVVETPLAPEEERAAPSEDIIPAEAPAEEAPVEAPVEAPKPKARAKRAPRPKAKVKVVPAPEPEVIEEVTEAPPEPKVKRQPRAKPPAPPPPEVVVPRAPTLDEVMEMFRRSEAERRAMKRNIYRSLVRL